MVLMTSLSQQVNQYTSLLFKPFFFVCLSHLSRVYTTAVEALFNRVSLPAKPHPVVFYSLLSLSPFTYEPQPLF